MSSYQTKLFSQQQKVSLSVKSEEIICVPSDVKRNALSFSADQYATLGNALNNIFPEKKDETNLERARRILGEIASGIPDDELIGGLAQFQSLLDSWFDEFEKNIFDGKTLNNLLRRGNDG